MYGPTDICFKSVSDGERTHGNMLFTAVCVHRRRAAYCRIQVLNFSFWSFYDSPVWFVNPDMKDVYRFEARSVGVDQQSEISHGAVRLQIHSERRLPRPFAVILEAIDGF